MPAVITEGESHFLNVPTDCWLSCLAIEDGTTYYIKCLSAFPPPSLHSLGSISYAVCFCCLIGVHVPWLNGSFSFGWQRPCSTSWFSTVWSVYRLTRNAKNMWWWKQPFNCFENKKTLNDEGIHTHTLIHTAPSCHRPATHHSQQSYLMTPGNHNVCYSCRRVRSEETAVLLKHFDTEKSERSQIPLHGGCHPWAVIIIQHLHFLRMTLH